MSARPIGILDSGVGGLSVAREMLRRMPEESLIYIGDSARAPYGPRSNAEIRQFTWDMVNFLLSKNVKLIIFACNTATAVVLDEISAQLDIPVIGVIPAGVRGGLLATRTKKLAVIGTDATIKSGKYAALIHAVAPDAEVESLACPEFVSLIESGDLTSQIAQKLVADGLQALPAGSYDTLILGCTHYPLLHDVIQKVVGPDIALIDAGAQAVNDVEVTLKDLKIAALADTKNAQVQYFTTGAAEKFDAIASLFLGKSVMSTSVEIGQPLLIATQNPGKIAEFEHALGVRGYRIKTLLDFPNFPEIEETGATFAENALLKARALAQLTKNVVIADDSGLCVDVLDGAPGIYSHRFAGENPTADENNQKLLREMRAVSDLRARRAHFHATLVAVSCSKTPLIVSADWPGYIAFEPKGTGGFGYNPIFLVGETGKTAAELTLEEKNELSHRALALKKLLKELPNWLNKEVL
ncbi:MAG: glutamate racemase [Streptococcaceae bacterium]|jgi:glutamate racemase|nr:glutamate racemase [Streptococcaceae bacterium]